MSSNGGKSLASIISDDQLFALMQFKRNASDLCKFPYHNDRFLYRWLVARNFNVPNAEKMLRESMKWRKEWDADNVDDYLKNEVCDKYYIGGICGHDMEGCPIVVLPIMKLDFMGFVNSVYKDDFIRYTVYKLETFLIAARESAVVNGPQAEQLFGIIDVRDFNVRHFAHQTVLNRIITLLQMYEANYPEVLKVCYIINAPKVFTLAFSLIKPFLNEITLSKIHIYKADQSKWLPEILDKVSPDQLPKYLGGNMVDPDGDPFCSSKIQQGGKVPKTYYMKNIMEKLMLDTSQSYTSAIIKNGEKLKLNYLVSDEGTKLRWAFYTEKYDVKFGVWSRDIEGNETELIPLERVPCNKVEQIKEIFCTQATCYTLLFDNSYSVLRSKKIFYKISLEVPYAQEAEP